MNEGIARRFLSTEEYEYFYGGAKRSLNMKYEQEGEVFAPQPGDIVRHSDRDYTVQRDGSYRRVK